MFNITNHQRKANKNHNDISHLSEWLKSKRAQITNDGENVERMEALYTVSGNVDWCSQLRKTAEFPQKTKNRTTTWHRNSTPWYILNKKKRLIWKYTCTPMFIATLFTITKIWKPPECLSTKKWIKMMWYIYIWYTHTQWNTAQP